jgi:hydroxymethylpyrimidine pyrophosphatase-like HAD family hydrolase
MNDGTNWYVEEKRAYGDPRLAPCDDLLGAAGREEVASIVGFVRNAEAAVLSKSLRQEVGSEAVVYCAQNYYCPGWTEVQVQQRAAEKGAAVPALLEACDAVGASVIACGDHLNDLGLFAASTHCIAPANAHPTVLASATEVVGSNDEDGVVRHLLDRHAPLGHDSEFLG